MKKVNVTLNHCQKNGTCNVCPEHGNRQDVSHPDSTKPIYSCAKCHIEFHSSGRITRKYD